MPQRGYWDRLRDMLSYKRFKHSLGVRDTAVKLAEIYGADSRKAALAGLLHDCARDLPGEKLLVLARQNHIPVDEVDEALPVILHAPVGALLAGRQFGVQDQAVLQAIALHTLGDKDMTLLDKIIFVADKAEPGRAFPGVQELREIMWRDLDRAMLWCLDAAITMSLRNSELIHPKAVSTRNWIRLKLN